MLSKAQETAEEFLQIKEADVLNKFHNLPKAYSDGYGQNRFVYIPGNRQDRVLLVAHADSVWGNLDIKLSIKDDIISSANKDLEYEQTNQHNYTCKKKGIGIGADDRAGCAILWELRDLGHSLLITNGEESGCIAAKTLAEDTWWSKEFNETHNFAVEFDRKDEKDIVFYDIGTKSFADEVKKETSFKPEYGSSTDIKHICKRICGVNLSVGYTGPHFADEKLYINSWLNTLKVANDWLSKGTKKFELNKSDLFTMSQTYDTSNCNNNSYNNNSWNHNKISSNDEIKCKYCKCLITYEEWFAAYLSCPKCKRVI